MNSPAPAVEHDSLSRLRQFAAQGHLYALFDSYDAPSLFAKVQKLGPDVATPLLHTDIEKQHWLLAPYLVASDVGFLDWILENLSQRAWGVFVVSHARSTELAEHLRTLLFVQLPDGGQFYFRYYDPRILKLYLANCLPNEWLQFFGPVSAYGMPDPLMAQIIILELPEAIRVVAHVRNKESVTIRADQYEALQSASMQSFEDRVLEHLREFFPALSRELGETATRQAITYGIQRAASYGFAFETDICKFIDLMFAFGFEFDCDPSLPWAAKILNDPQIPAPDTRMQCLFETAGKHVQGAEQQ